MLGFNFYRLFKQWLIKRKRGDKGNTGILISWEQKKLSRWNKKPFLNFFRGCHLLIKKKQTQALTIAWYICKKDINIISWLVLRNEPAMLVWWGTSGFYCLKNYCNTKRLYCSNMAFFTIYMYINSSQF